MKKTEKNLKQTISDLEKSHKELNHSAEKLKAYTKKLESLNEHKDKLFSIIAHDLRSPFQVLTSVANILIEDMESLNKEEILHIAHELKKTIKTQFEVVDNLLTWVQLQQGRMEPSLRRIFLSDKVNKVINQLKIHLQIKNIQIINSVPDNFIVNGDMEMLQTIFHNLIYNGIKFSNPGGLITINAHKSNNEIITSVSDNGVGIQEDMQKIIFNIDKTSNRKGTHDEKGTGLGLNLCKEMVEKQGGKIWVESQEGKGSTFYFSLPAAGEYINN